MFGVGQGVNRDAWVMGPKKFTDAAAVDDLQDGKMVKVSVRNRPIVLLKHDDGIHAFDGTCPHRGCNLWEGKLQGHVLACPCHNSQFDVTDGRVVHGPATAPVPSYDVRENNGRVEIKLRQ